MKKLGKRLLSIVLAGMLIASNAVLSITAAAAETEIYQTSGSSDYLNQAISNSTDHYYYSPDETYGGYDGYINCFEYTVISEDINLGTEDNSIIIPAGTIAITNISTNDYGIAVPSEIYGRKVTVIDSNAFSNSNSSLHSVALPNTIIAIGARAFFSCSNLTNVSIPNSVKFIGESAFAGCSSLRSIGFPDSVSVFGEHVLDGFSGKVCTFRKSAAEAYAKANNIDIDFLVPSDFIYSENIEDNSQNDYYYRYYNNSITVVGYKGSADSIVIPSTIDGKVVTAIGVEDPYGQYVNSNNEINTVVVPDTVTAFNRCFSRAGAVSLPDSVTYIGNQAFAYSMLDAITMPSGLISIGDEAFQYCGLNKAYIPDSVVSIGNRAFSECHGLRTVILPEGVTVGDSAFDQCSSINMAVVPKSVTLGNDAITASRIAGSYNSDAKNYADQKGIEFVDISSYNFNYSINSDYVSIYGYIGDDENVIIPETIEGLPVKEISSDIFENSYNYQYRNRCPNFVVNSVTIPNCVSNVSSSAFYSNYRLTVCAHQDALFLSNGFHAGINVFLDLDSLECQNNENTTVITKYNHNDTNNYTYYENDYISLPKIIDGRKLVGIGPEAFESSSRLSYIIIPDTVSYIGERAFQENSYLRYVCLPSSVSEIGINAFADCTNLNVVTPYLGDFKDNKIDWSNSNSYSIVLPASVRALGEGAFSNCNNITSITLPNSIIILLQDVFNSCSSVRNVTLPTQLQAILSNAFYDCYNLNSITVPRSVKYIEYNAFSYNSSLIVRGYLDTEAERYAHSNNLTFEAFNDSLFDYEISGNDSVTITGYTGSENYGSTLEIPETINGKTVVKIGEYAFADNSVYENFIIPETVTEIEDGAFENCSALTSITLHNSVTAIGSDVFKNCSSLQSITLPNQLTKISSGLFERCSRLQTITLPETLTTISSNAFSGCSELKNINIPASVTSIGDEAFALCSALTSINIPNSVSSIGSSAFSSCSKLTSIVIPPSIRKIESGTFSYCSNLESITIPNSVTSIGWSAFSSCRKLKNITLPTSLKSISDRAFSNCSTLESITIPNGVTSIGNSAFYYCNVLKQISIPNTVTSIGNYAFWYCTSLETVSIPNSVNSMGYSVFEDCSSLKSIVIPNSVTVIPRYAFEDCKTLSSVIIPNSVTTISDYAFRNCTALTNITIPKTVTNIYNDSFKGCTNLTISGYKNSAAEKFAANQNIPFVTLSEEVLKNTSSVQSSSIVLGNTINITGAATGGTAPYTYSYYFKKTSQSTWTAKAENTSSTSVTVKPGSAVEYSVKVVVADKDGSTAEKIMKVSVNPALTNKSTVASQSITLGNTINVTGSASGGKAPYTYSYYFKQASQSTWTTKLANTTSTSVTIKPGSAVDYNVKVTVKDSSGKTEDKIFTVKVNNAAAFENISTVASDSIILGNTINVTGAAQGGTAPYKYSYYFKKASQSSWTTKLENSATTSVTIKPGSAVNYNVKVTAVDNNGTKAEKTFTVKVTNGNDLLNNSSVASSSITLGDTINITGAASGGTAPYKYSYYFKKASQSDWTTKLANSSSTTTTVKPGSAVDYNVKVVVEDSNGKKAEKTFTVKVIAPLTNKSSVASTTITLGSTINITGAASGGTAPYKYSYYFKQSSQSTWSTKTADTTSTSVTIKPGSAVEYKVKVTVTDKNGKTADKIFTVNVTK